MNNDRRMIIKACLAGGLVLGGTQLLTGCGGVTRSSINGRPESGDLPGGLGRREANILHYASLAPSSHNAQPWYVRVESPESWIIGLDQDRLLPVVDPHNREMFLSLGAFVENLVLAAGNLGLAAGVEVITDTTGPGDVARISLAPARGKPADMSLLQARMTVREGYADRELAEADLKELAAAAGPGLHYFNRESDHGQCMAEGAVKAFRTQTADDRAQEELGRWTRLSNSRAREHRDGLTCASMDITGLAGWWVRNFMSAQDVTGEKWRSAGIEKAEEQAAHGAGWLVMTGPASTPGQLLEGGRRFQRLALEACRLKIGIHPMSQMLEEKIGREEMAASHEKDISPLFMIRVGYVAEYPAPVSLRRPPSWFVRG